MKITNVVVSARVPPQDLNSAATMLSRSGYHVTWGGRRSLVVNCDNSVRVILMSGGIVVGTGTPHRDEAEDAVRKVTAALGVQLSSLRLVNLTAVCDLGESVSEVPLQDLAVMLPSSELRRSKPPCALVWKPGVGSVTMLIFSSGRVVLVGARNMEEVERAVSALKAFLF